MIANNKDSIESSGRANRWLPWFNLALVIALIALGVWYLADKVSLAEIVQAIILAKPGYILLALLLMIVTLMLKAWRWQLMFNKQDAPRYAPLFWSMMLGQYVNLIVPFLRLGEIARIYALNRQTDIPMARSLGTLVVEKVLEAIMLALTIGVLLPFVILPEFVGDPGWILWAMPLAALLILYLLAYQTEHITRFFQAISKKFPTKIGKRLLKWAISGLEGLSSLRSTRLTLMLVGSSAMIAFLAVLLPYVLIIAFDLPLGLVEASVIYIVVTLATTLPSTPGKIGVFDGAVALVLLSYGLTDPAVIISYSIVFHLVVVVPQIILGSIAAARTDWRWRRSVEEQLAA